MKKTLLFFTLLAFGVLNAQIVNIPDANFKNTLISGTIEGSDGFYPIAYDSDENEMTTVDANGDGEIQVSEAQNVYKLDFLPQGGPVNPINDLTGIEAFENLTNLVCANNQLTNLDVSQNTNLTHLNCNDNQLNSLVLNINLTNLSCRNNQLSSLDVSQNTNLAYLYCIHNMLGNLDVSQNPSLATLICGNNQLSNLVLNPNLTYLTCDNNQLSSLDVSQNTNLTNLGCGNNQLSSLDVSQNTNLASLGCANNQLSSLDVSQNPGLVTLSCYSDQLTNLDVSQNPSLTNLFCGNNQLSSLDVSQNTNLTNLYCNYNANLSYVNLKNGNNMLISELRFTNLPNLQTVCVDELDSEITNDIRLDVGHSVTFTEYCSLVPAQSNTITGTAFLDLDNNGCDNTDIVFNDFLITTSNGTESFTTNVQSDGSYVLYTGEGDFTTNFTANLPSFFSASPASYSNTFTGFDNTFTADFCITANQTVNDVNISVIPSQARPGFDTSYQIVYKNVGTTTLNGTVSFNYDNTKLDFLSASETISTQTNNQLNFDYTNLNPFERRIITLDFNVHTPTASQPTNIGDVLDFTAVINPTTGDYTPADNTFTFHQTVIGSYDPNDITCLEGNEILLADTDKYLHYVIRFQNTGTADAINVVVKNILDDKLDWNTLQLEATSHNSRVAIKNGNDVEFIFEDIHLPDSTTDEPGSHGYVAYKIKPKNNVALGDTFNDKADIFFDYNAAIETNIASTTVVNALSVDSAQLLQFSVYPTPTKGLLTIHAATAIKSVAVYSKLGQLVLKETNASQIDISKLAQGVYFVKVVDVNGDFGSRKIIKN